MSPAQKLEKDQLSLGVGVRLTRSVEIAAAMASSGFDWLFPLRDMSMQQCRGWMPARRSLPRRWEAGITPIATRAE